MSISQAALLCNLLFLFLVIFNFRKSNHIINLLPSCGWAMVMVIPFILQWDYFFQPTRETHATGILIVAIALLVADSLALLKCKKTEASIQLNRKKFLIYTLPVITITAIICHLWLSNKIPLLEFIFGQRDYNTLLDMRNIFSRDTTLHFTLKYLFNWITPILAVLSIAFLFFQKRYFLASILLTLSVFYALAALAKAPLLILFSSLMVIVLGLYHRQTRLPLLASIIIAPVFISSTIVFHTNNKFRTEKSNLPLNMTTPGDHLRLDKGKRVNVSTADSIIRIYTNIVIYRLLLVPSEVGQRWYDYAKFHNPFGYSDIIPGGRPEGFIHPARKVATWAYYSRFPELYSKDSHAYTAIDADAYARAGYIAVILTAFILFLLRLLPAYLVTNDPFSRMIYYNHVALLTLLPAHASIQAILIANGLFLLPLMLAFVRRW